LEIDKEVWKSHHCFCGRWREQTYKTVRTYYKSKEFTVLNVLVYDCGKHDVLPILVRKKMRKQLKEAYGNNNFEFTLK